MTQSKREKAAAVCESCGAICVAWVLPDGAVVPVSATVECACEKMELRALDRLETRSEG